MSEYAWYDEDGTFGDTLRRCLLAASASPSIHNTQPWLFRPSARVVDILVDRRRQLTALDPDGREMLVSVGAAVFTLRLAICAHGRESRVRLLPDPADPDVAARVTLGGPVAPTPGALALASAIAGRHTNRRPYADQPIPDAVMGELIIAAAREHATVVPVDPAMCDGILSLTRAAETRLRTDAGYQAELAAWTTAGGFGRRDGVPREVLGPRDVDGALPLRDFGAGHGTSAATVAFEPDPALILLYTVGDSVANWLHAGMALQRVWLTATRHGLSATPLTQSLEVPRLRALLADSSNGRVVQSVLRIGYPTTPGTPTPRRDLRDLIVERQPPGR